jgi:hypothetical protein
VLKFAPSVDSRLRASDMTMRYTAGLEKVIRLEGFPGVREAFESIKSSIRGRLATDVAASLVQAIQEDLRKL